MFKYGGVYFYIVCLSSAAYCGKQLPHITSYPYMVAILKIHKNQNKESINDMQGKFEFVCGGTLVSSSFVVTAAHCLIQFRQNDYYVVYNTSYFIMSASDNKIRVSNITNEDNYSAEWRCTNHDITLLQLSAPVFSSHVNMEKYNFNTYEEATVVYWEQQNDKNIYSMQYINVTIYNETVCKIADSGKQYIYENICAGTSDNKFYFQYGHSGDPLFVHTQKGESLLGILYCGYPHIANQTYPVAFISISHYYKWIKNVINDSEKKSDSTTIENGNFNKKLPKGRSSSVVQNDVLNYFLLFYLLMLY